MMQNKNDCHPYPPSLLIPEQTYQEKMNATKARFLNEDQALDAMERGQVVRGIDGLFQTHVEHGGLYLYRWHNDEVQRLKDGVWSKSKSFHLNSQFEIWEGQDEEEDYDFWRKQGVTPISTTTVIYKGTINMDIKGHLAKLETPIEPKRCRECNAVINEAEERDDESLCKECDYTAGCEWDLRDDSKEDWLSLD